jgi:hypothetical protein
VLYTRVVSQMNPDHSSSHCDSKIHYDIILVTYRLMEYVKHDRHFTESGFMDRICLISLGEKFFNRAPRHEGILGEWRYSSTHSLSSALEGGEWSVSRLGRFTSREEPLVPIG